MRFLFVDRITELVPGKYTRGLKHITADDAFLYLNKAGNYQFASSLIGETLGQLTAWNVMYCHEFKRRPVAGIVAHACLLKPVYLGDTVELESFIEHLDEQSVYYRSVAKVNKEPVFTVEEALGPLLPMEKFISEEAVRYQFQAIYRPNADLSYDFSSRQLLLKPFASIPLQFDTVISHSPGEILVAEKRINLSAPYFADHFPYHPVLPMTVLLECKLHLAQLFLEKAIWNIAYQVKGFKKIKMNEFVLPGDIVETTLTVPTQNETELIMRFKTTVQGRRVCTADLIFAV